MRYAQLLGVGRKIESPASDGSRGLSPYALGLRGIKATLGTVGALLRLKKHAHFVLAFVARRRLRTISCQPA